MLKILKNNYFKMIIAFLFAHTFMLGLFWWSYNNIDKRGLHPIVSLLIILSISFLTVFILWFFRTKEGEGTGVVIPQYEVMSEVTPSEVGRLVFERFEKNNLTAEIVYLAQLGYLKILNFKTKIKDNYVLEQTGHRVYWSKLKNHQQHLLNYFFVSSKTFGKEKLLTSLSDVAYFYNARYGDRASAIIQKMDSSTRLFSLDSIFDTVNNLVEDNVVIYNPSRLNFNFQKIVNSNIIGYGWEDKNTESKVWRTFWIIFIVTFIDYLFVKILFAPYIILPLLFFVFVPSTTLFMLHIFSPLLSRRTHLGVKAREYFLGLKKYISVTDYGDVSPEATLDESLKKNKPLLSFVIALGLGDEWSKKYKEGITSPPSWFETTDPNFTVDMLVNTIYSFPTIIPNKTNIGIPLPPQRKVTHHTDTVYTPKP